VKGGCRRDRTRAAAGGEVSKNFGRDLETIRAGEVNGKKKTTWNVLKMRGALKECWIGIVHLMTKAVREVANAKGRGGRDTKPVSPHEDVNEKTSYKN